MTGMVQSIYSGEISCTKGYCGWPTLVQYSAGELLVVCSGGREEHVCPFGRVHLYRSADGGRHWAGPEIITEGPLDDRDAGIFRTKSGTLLLNWFTNILALSGKDIPEHWRKIAREISLETLRQEHGFWMKRSVDGGRSWSEKFRIPANCPHGGTVLNDGSLFMVGRECSNSIGYQYEGSCLGERIIAVHSVDDGVTWKEFSVLPMPPGHLTNKCFEPYAVQMPEGRIIVELRDQSMYPRIETWQTESEDGGRTWTVPHSIGEGYPSHLLTFDADKLLLTYGWRQLPYGVHVRISENAGGEWSEEMVLYEGAQNNDLGYPTTVCMENGDFFTLWYESVDGLAKLKFCRWRLQ